MSSIHITDCITDKLALREKLYFFLFSQHCKPDRKHTHIFLNMFLECISRSVSHTINTTANLSSLYPRYRPCVGYTQFCQLQLYLEDMSSRQLMGEKSSSDLSKWLFTNDQLKCAIEQYIYPINKLSRMKFHFKCEIALCFYYRHKYKCGSVTILFDFILHQPFQIICTTITIAIVT